MPHSTPPPTATPPLLQQHLHWGAEALWEQLEPLLPGLSVEVVARTDSTNTRLLERARESSGQPDARVTRPGELDALPHDDRTPLGRRQGDVQPCLLVAEHQTRGRGRLGRGWEGAAGASLTFSLSLPLAPADWSGLSLAVGLALAQALDSDLPAGQAPRVQLKWPNDLWLVLPPDGADVSTNASTDASTERDATRLPGRKLGGILIETISVGQRRMCVVGIGLNVSPQVLDGLAHGYACVQEIDPAATAPRVLARVVEPLVRALLAFQAQGFAPLAAAYAQRDLLAGRAVTTTLADGPQGVAEGVDERGALRVRSGALHHVVSGEVSVRLRAGEPGASVATLAESDAGAAADTADAVDAPDGRSSGAADASP